MGGRFEAMGCIMMMLSGSMADSENLVPFIVVILISLLLVVVGAIMKSVKKRRKVGKYNYYLRKSY